MPPDDYTIAAIAAEKVIRADIVAHVPAFFQGKIPDDVPRKLAQEVGKAVVDALAAAHTASPSSS